MTKDELKKDLVRLSLAEMRKHKRRFSPDAEKELGELISSGVERMFDEEKHDNDSIELARTNASQFINNMCKKNRSSIIDKRAFYLARLSICPIWPFC